MIYKSERLNSIFKPAAELGFEDDSPIPAALYNYASGANWMVGPNGKPLQVGQPGLGITHRMWAWPIYDKADANRTITVWRNPHGSVWDEPARWSTVPEFKNPKSLKAFKLPFRSSWKTGEGSDQGILIKDGDTFYSVLNLRQSNIIDRLLIATRTLTLWPFSHANALEGHWVCDGLKVVTPENADKIVGCGSGNIPKNVGILTADMLANGVDQALSLVVTNTMMGEGAVFRLPGTRVEHIDIPGRMKYAEGAKNMPVGYDDRMVPSGTRVVVNKTPEQIYEWAMTKPVEMQGAAYRLGVGLVTYGMIVKETGNGGWQIESEGTLNPVTEDKFAQVGLKKKEDFSSLLDGLINGPGDLRLVKQSPAE